MKNKILLKLAIIYMTFITSSGLCAQDNTGSDPNNSAQKEEKSIRWDLQVTDPEFELTNYKLENKEFKPYLKKTSWRCQVSEQTLKGPIAIRSLLCDYSVEKAGTVKTFVSCSSDRPYSEGVLELYDERKDLTFQVMLTCRVK